ncbi:MAG: hypothetical protein J6S67_03605 [Methanobrevibacter sp.]|nr:hypothetical protein [Methanobrevibacter sp.]
MEHIKVKYNPTVWDDLIRDSRYIASHYKHEKQLESCQAYIRTVCDNDYQTLISYITPVAFYDIRDNSVLDYSRIVFREHKYPPNADTPPQPLANSHTTSQHIWKFARKLGADYMITLYPGPNGEIYNTVREVK